MLVFLEQCGVDMGLEGLPMACCVRLGCKSNCKTDTDSKSGQLVA